jgi:hypothetical protein
MPHRRRLRRLSSTRPAGIDRDHRAKMAKAVAAHLEQLEADDAADRRKWLLSTPSADRDGRHRTQWAAYTALQVGRGDTSLCALYTPEDRVILSAFVHGLSTRKVGECCWRPWPANQRRDGA